MGLCEHPGVAPSSHPGWFCPWPWAVSSNVRADQFFAEPLTEDKPLQISVVPLHAAHPSSVLSPVNASCLHPAGLLAPSSQLAECERCSLGSPLHAVNRKLSGNKPGFISPGSRHSELTVLPCLMVTVLKSNCLSRWRSPASALSARTPITPRL